MFIGHGPNPEKGLFFVFVATFWRQSEYTCSRSTRVCRILKNKVPMKKVAHFWGGGQFRPKMYEICDFCDLPFFKSDLYLNSKRDWYIPRMKVSNPE